MDSLIKIVNNMADDEKSHTEICDFICSNQYCIDVECDSCIFLNDSSLKRAKNVINNRWKQ